MRTRTTMIAAALLITAGCAEQTISTANTSPLLVRIPAAVVEIAAPNQDLATARLLQEDGCYWYLHSGPVETTLLPLRTESGSPICTARGT